MEGLPAELCLGFWKHAMYALNLELGVHFPNVSFIELPWPLTVPLGLESQQDGPLLEVGV